MYTETVPVKKVESYKPQPRQLEAHESWAEYVLYGGAMGGGKSCWIVNCAIDLSMRIPNNVGFLCRHEFTSFYRSTYVELFNWLDDSLIKRHDKQMKEIHFKNGSKIYYGGLGDDKKAVDKVKSMQLGWFAIDQAEETSKKHFEMLATRLRLNIPGVVFKGLMTANPTDNWVKNLFIIESARDRAFIPALPGDNKYNPKDYEERMRSILPPEIYVAWMEGNWDIVSDENVVFPALNVSNAMRRESKMIADVSQVGIDVARDGNDETVFCFKRGNKYTFRIYRRRSVDTMDTADNVKREMLNHPNASFRIDTIGLGGGVYDNVRRSLRELKNKGFRGNLLEYKSSYASKSRQYKNKRAEDHFQLTKDLDHIDIPNDEKLRSQMTIRYHTLTSDGVVRVEKKEDFKKRVKMSPDRLDALVIAHAKMKAKRTGSVIHR
jgi:hypothetical protein